MSWIADFLGEHRKYSRSSLIICLKRVKLLPQGKSYAHDCSLEVEYLDVGSEADLFSKLHHFLTEADKEFAKMETTLNRASHYFSIMLSMELRNNYLKLIQEASNTNISHRPMLEAEQKVSAFCSASIADLLKLNKQFAEALGTANLTEIKRERFGSKQVRLLYDQFNPLWDQFESTTGSLISCLRKYPNVIARTNSWISSFDLDSNVNQAFDQAGISSAMELIEHFSGQLYEHYHNYMLGTEGKA